jgi:glycosyltransferase involved in cell wall biosynthesis
MQKTITFIYPGGSGFSGQRFASQLLMDGLRKKSWNILVVPVPTLDRVTERKFLNWYVLSIQGLKIGFKLLETWINFIKFSFKTDILHISLGQTKFAIIRDAFPLIFNHLIVVRDRVIISLHGNNFMSWNFDDLEAKIMRSISRKVKYITVVGPHQKRQLSNLGIAEKKIVLMDNTCSLRPLSHADILIKHEIQHTKQPIFVLFLSSLIESKGYAEFVKSIYQLSNSSNLFIEAVLCGPITIGREDENQFLSHAAAKSWIEDQINQINQSSSVRLRWIDGAVGKQKEELFHQAHIFVLPSRYKVEAQPIALLEALASGCAVITTKVGEIPTTVSEDTALFLSECSPIAIYYGIKELCENQNKRLKLATNGVKLFQERFSYETHIDRWEDLLSDLIDQ